MKHEYTAQSNVDIYTKPDVDWRHPAIPGTELTVGDLHGNAIKLLHKLVLHGVVREIADDSYRTLVDIYKKNLAKLTQSDLQTFVSIVSGLEFRKSMLIRLIGDVLCDRGNNDYFTLLLLNQMHNAGVPYEILYSNHDREFIKHHDDGRVSGDYASAYARPDDLNNIRNEITEGQSCSMRNMGSLMQRGLLDSQSIDSMVQKAYFPKFKLISYSRDENGLTIYTHAPVGLETIQTAATKLGVEYNNTSITALTLTIDRINQAFQTHLSSNTLMTDIDIPNSEHYNKQWDQNFIETQPLWFFAWSRIQYARDISRRDRPSELNGFTLRFVHGHDPGALSVFKRYAPEERLVHVVNLDESNQSGHSQHGADSRTSEFSSNIYFSCAPFVQNLLATDDQHLLQQNLEIFDKLEALGLLQPLHDSGLLQSLHASGLLQPLYASGLLQPLYASGLLSLLSMGDLGNLNNSVLSQNETQKAHFLGILNAIADIRLKASELESRGITDTAANFEAFCNAVTNRLKQFINVIAAPGNSDNNKEYRDFQHFCLSKIESIRPEAEQHRSTGLVGALTTLANAICAVAAFVFNFLDLVTDAKARREFLAQPALRTNSAKKIDALEEATQPPSP